MSLRVLWQTGYQRFGREFALHFQGAGVLLTVKMEATCSTKMLLSSKLYGVISLEAVTIITSMKKIKPHKRGISEGKGVKRLVYEKM
jgi:hypothetical protein